MPNFRGLFLFASPAVTPGFSGAELFAMINEAAISAAKQDVDHISLKMIEEVGLLAAPQGPAADSGLGGPPARCAPSSDGAVCAPLPRRPVTRS